MPKIVVKRKAEVYKEFPIRPFLSRITVGSEGDNDLIISDKKVSMHQFIIEKESNQYFITDTNSAFGTILNGKKIEKRNRLSSGDVIRIGDHSLIFENTIFENNNNGIIDNSKREPREEKKPATNPNTVNINLAKSSEKSESPDIDVVKETKAEADKDIQKDKINPTPHYLLTIFGPYLGSKYRLNLGTTKIGRDKTLNDIIINKATNGEIDTSISRRHATILYEDDNYFIMDKRSKTRTRLNRRELKEDDLLQLSPQDEIEIVSDQMSTIFRFVPEGNQNTDRPRKAGYWWLRNGHRFRKVSSLLFSFLLILIAVYNFGKLTIINQKPEPLKFSEQPFYHEDGDSDILLSKEEVENNIPGLSPATADLNGDGYLDLIYLDKIGYLKVIDGKRKSLMWEIVKQYRARPTTCFVLADINDDGFSDIVFPAHNSVVYALEGKTGVEIWSSPILGREFIGLPVVSDLNGDSILDIFICGSSGQVHIGHGTFSEPEWKTLKLTDEITSPPSAGDIDNDGLVEIVFATKKAKIQIYDDQENSFVKTIDVNEEFQKAKGSFFEDHEIVRRIGMGKINSDAYSDLLLLTETNHLLAFDVAKNSRIWYEVLKVGEDSSSLAPLNMADINGDKKVDAVIVSNDNKVIAYESSGNGTGERRILWGYLPQKEESFVSAPVLADINKDGNIDVVVADFHAGINVFDGQNGNLLYKTEIDSTMNFASVGTPLVADFNSDSWLDILVRKNDDSFVLIKTNNRVFRSSVFWGQLNFNFHQNGFQQFKKSTAWQYLFFIISAVVLLLIIIYANIKTERTRRSYFKKT